MIFSILGQTLEILGTRSNEIVRAIVVPALLVVAVNTLGPWPSLSWFGAVLAAVLELLAFTWLAVSVHRVILKDEPFRFQFGSREFRYVGWLLLLWLTIFAAIWLVIATFQSIGFPASGFVGGTFNAGVTLLVLYWFSQYFLILPAIAVDQKYSIKHSSVDTEENRPTAFMVVAGLPLLLSLVKLPVGQISDPFLGSLIDSVLSVFCVTLGVVLLSALYKELGPKAN